MIVKTIRVPHGNGWYTFVRGVEISRMQGLRIFLGGKVMSKIETIQSNDVDYFKNAVHVKRPGPRSSG